MSEGQIRIARRIMVYMLDAAELQVDMSFFQGLGLALLVCYEEMTGRPGKSVKPKDLLEWAKDLPQETYPHIKEN